MLTLVVAALVDLNGNLPTTPHELTLKAVQSFQQTGHLFSGQFVIFSFSPYCSEGLVIDVRSCQVPHRRTSGSQEVIEYPRIGLLVHVDYILVNKVLYERHGYGIVSEVTALFSLRRMVTPADKGTAFHFEDRSLAPPRLLPPQSVPFSRRV